MAKKLSSRSIRIKIEYTLRDGALKRHRVHSRTSARTLPLCPGTPKPKRVHVVPTHHRHENGCTLLSTAGIKVAFA